MKLTKLLDEKIEEMFLVFTLVIMVVLIFSQAAFRSLSFGSLTWGEELTRYLHIWQIWIGASLAVRKGEHIRVTFFRNIFPEKGRMAIDLLAAVCWFGFALFIAVEGTSFVSGIFDAGQKTPSMGILMGIPYLAIPIGGVLMSIRLIQQIFFIIKGNGMPEEQELV